MKQMKLKELLLKINKHAVLILGNCNGQDASYIVIIILIIIIIIIKSSIHESDKKSKIHNILIYRLK